MGSGQEVSVSKASAGYLAAANAAIARNDLNGAVDEAVRLAGEDGAESLEQAIGVLDRVLAITEEHLPGLLERSRLRARAGDHSGAVHDAASAVAVAPDQAVPNAVLAERMRAVGRLDEAAMFAYEALKAAPEEPLHYVALAEILHAQGAFEAAEELLRTAQPLAPGEVGIALLRMDCLMNLNREADAIHLGEMARRQFPGDAQVLRNLGNAFKLAGRVDAALEAFQSALLLTPDDGYASHMVRTLKGETPARIEPDYLKVVFDGVAAEFDELMLERQHYRVPGLLARVFARHMPGPGLKILDLGCGTGLSGLMLREIAFFLKGVDISPGMAGIAGGKGFYAEIEVGDIEVALATDTRFYDAVVAGDTLPYFGDLEPLARLVKARLRPGGLFVFSVERGPDARTPFALAASGRFVHSVSELRRVAAAAGLTVLEIEAEKLKLVNGTAVDGLIAALQLPLA